MIVHCRLFNNVNKMVLMSVRGAPAVARLGGVALPRRPSPAAAFKVGGRSDILGTH